MPSPGIEPVTFCFETPNLTTTPPEAVLSEVLSTRTTVCPMQITWQGTRHEPKTERCADSAASGGAVVKFGALMQEVAGSIPGEGMFTQF